MKRFSLLLLLVGCKRPEGEAPDLVERIGPGEARAGVVTDDAALFGGISAEGALGDVKIYNSQVRFVIQNVRGGSYYVAQGGGVIDADVTRPEGQPGRDMVDEWSGMYGFGRLLEPSAVTVVDNGALGGPAIVHVEGGEAPMALVTGALESESLIPDLGLQIATDYILWPDTPLLEVRTTLTAAAAASIQPGDVLMGALEVVEPWDPGVGRLTPGGTDRVWSGFAGLENDLAMAIVAAPGNSLAQSPLDALASELQMAIAVGEEVDIPAGGSATFVRYYAVGHDLAEISDAVIDLRGEPFDEVGGTVTAPDGPVPGARVNVLVDGAPYTLAFTGDDGTFTAKVPAGSEATFLAVGRATGRFRDLPEGAAPYGPYGAAPARAQTLEALRSGALPVPVAEGRGVADASNPLVLAEPGWLVIRCADGLPFEARVGFLDGEPAADPALVPGFPSGNAALAWARDGEVRLPVEAGTYDLVAHRGIRFELARQQVTVEAGAETVVEVALPAAYSHEGWLLGDPHVHASPSGDASIPMEDRLVVAAAVGLQVHFGTDHDHVADYRPLLAPLGLDQVLASVISDEVSPVLRGHMNIYPLSAAPDEPNGGAWPWWSDAVPDTASAFAELRRRHGDFILQLNHPTDSGVAQMAAWSPGIIGEPTRWADGYDAVEVLNSGDHGDFAAFWQDTFLRGVLSTPIGVSDSHGHTAGLFGASATFLGMGTDDAAAYDDESLKEAMRSRRTVVTLGPFLRQSPDPGSTVTGSATITVEALSPTWIHVDRLVLMRDGEAIETVEGTSATFTAAPEKDAAYWVVAEGDAPMAPIYSRTPWAMTSPVLVDVTGDGWEPPLAPLQMAE